MTLNNWKFETKRGYNVHMIKKILLCTDGSTFSNTAADYALVLAKKMGASVKALCVTDVRLLEGPYLADLGGALGAQPYQAIVPQMQAIQEEKANLTIDGVEAKFKDSGIELATLVKTGKPVATILEEEQDSDLVVLGKRGENAPYESDVIGSSVEWLARQSSKPCLVTPKKLRPIKKVVAAYDGSTHSEKALTNAFHLVRALGIPITIVTVAPEDEDDPVRWRNILNEGVEMADREGLSVSEALLRGDPEDKILQYCDEQSVDLLIIGAYGHSRIREFLLGSTTFQILLRSEIPVYLTR